MSREHETARRGCCLCEDDKQSAAEMNYVAIAGQNIGLERHLLDTRSRLR
jgi:hypothetical protein